MAMAPVFLFLFIQDDILLRGISLGVFAVAAITDYFDGYYARQYNVESDFGVFLDPLADKFLTFAGFVCLPFLDPSQFPWWAVILIVLRDITITLLRIYTDRKGIVLETRYTAKVKTAIQMGFLYVALLIGFFMLVPGTLSDFANMLLGTNVFYWGMVTVAFITVYSGVEYLYVNRGLFKSSAKQ